MPDSRSVNGETRRETPLECLDRNLEELTGELRVVVTGVQVLFAATGTWRGYEGGPEGLEILVFGAPNLGENPREDVDGQRGWWAYQRPVG
jgi:hypothetical protein